MIDAAWLSGQTELPPEPPRRFCRRRPYMCIGHSSRSGRAGKDRARSGRERRHGRSSYSAYHLRYQPESTKPQLIAPSTLCGTSRSPAHAIYPRSPSCTGHSPPRPCSAARAAKTCSMAGCPSTASTRARTGGGCLWGVSSRNFSPCFSASFWEPCRGTLKRERGGARPRRPRWSGARGRG